MSPRAAATLVSLVLLGAGCSDAAPERPAAEASATPPVTSVPTSPGPSPTKPEQPPRRLTLLPPVCRHDQLRLAPRTDGDGATGWTFTIWSFHLVGRRPCTVWGYPRLTLVDDHGVRLPFVVRHQRGQRIADGPAVVRPGRASSFAAAKYRCDVSRPVATSAAVRIRLPDVPGSFVAHSAVRLCGPADGEQRVAVYPFGHWYLRTAPPITRFAVELTSPFPPGRHPTWGRADLDGDGDQDLVIVSRSWVTARVDGEALRARIPRSPDHRLQGLVDLDGDGRPEILVAGSDSGRPYRVSMYATTVLHLAGHALVALNSRAPLPGARGVGDWCAGLHCGRGTFDHVSFYHSGQAPTATLTTTTFRIARHRLVVAHESRTTVTSSDRPAVRSALDAATTSCPGLTSDGWAIR